MFFKVYKFIITLCKPAVKYYLKTRISKGKEHPNRYIEKMGLPTQIRPQGELIWIHAVSVGESISALSIVEAYIAQNKNVLITTSTMSSAKIMEQRLPKKAIHQFCPIDVGVWVDSFLDYWQPSQVLWMESELWPTILHTLKKRRIKTFLVNARMSEKTISKLKYIPFIATQVFQCFDVIFVQDKKYISVMQHLTTITPKYLGNLKYSAPIMPPEEKMLSLFKNSVGTRPVWACISTHPEDEDFLKPALKKMHREIPNLLTIIIPRHPERMKFIEGSVKDLSYAVRSRRENITNTTDVYIADTIGEISLFLSATEVCFIGGSTGGDYGGHNPLEPANLNCAIIQGMDTNHFSGVCDALTQSGGQIQVQNYIDLKDTVKELLKNKTKRHALIKGASKVARDNKNIVKTILQAIDDAL